MSRQWKEIIRDAVGLLFCAVLFYICYCAAVMLESEIIWNLHFR